MKSSSSRKKVLTMAQIEKQNEELLDNDLKELIRESNSHQQGQNFESVTKPRQRSKPVRQQKVPVRQCSPEQEDMVLYQSEEVEENIAGEDASRNAGAASQSFGRKLQVKCLKYRIGRSEKRISEGKNVKAMMHDKAYKEIANTEQRTLAQSPKVKVANKN